MPEIKFTCDEVGDCHEVLERVVAARLYLCCLYEGVNARDEAAGDAAVEPGKDTVAIAHQRCGDLLHGFEARTSGPRAPAVKLDLSPLPVRFLIDVLARETHGPRTSGFQVVSSERVTCRHLASRQIGVVHQPEVAAALEFWPALGLVAPHFIDGITDQLHDMKLVEGDLGLGEVLAHASDVGTAHIDADLLYARCVRVVIVDSVGEPGYRVGAAAFGDVDDTTLIDRDEQRNVVAPASCGGLVDRDALQRSQIKLGERRLDVMMNDAPEFGVVPSEHAGCGRDRHVDDEHHSQRLDQQ